MLATTTPLPPPATPSTPSTAGGFFTTSVCQLTLRHAFTTARNTATEKRNVLVHCAAPACASAAERDAGDGARIVGVGEAAPNVRFGETTESSIECVELANRVLGDTVDAWHFAHVKQRVHADVLPGAQTAAKCGMDAALLDLAARRAGVPLYRFLGLDPQRAPTSSFTIGLDTPERMQAKIAEAADYPVLKIKVGTADDEAVMRAVREVTNKTLMVDANEGWPSKEHALERCRWFETMSTVAMVEQPLRASAIDDTAWLRERTRLPLFADEAVKTAADIPALARAYSGVNLKLAKSGGPQEALRSIGMARALGMQVMLGCMIESSVGIAVAAHLSPLVDFADLDGNLLVSNDPYCAAWLDNGKICLPDRPGLGVLPRDRDDDVDDVEQRRSDVRHDERDDHVAGESKRTT